MGAEDLGLDNLLEQHENRLAGSTKGIPTKNPVLPQKPLATVAAADATVVGGRQERIEWPPLRHKMFAACQQIEVKVGGGTSFSDTLKIWQLVGRLAMRSDENSNVSYMIDFMIESMITEKALRTNPLIGGFDDKKYLGYQSRLKGLLTSCGVSPKDADAAVDAIGKAIDGELQSHGLLTEAKRDTQEKPAAVATR